MIFYNLLDSQRKERKPEMGDLVKMTSGRYQKPFGRSLFLDQSNVTEEIKTERDPLKIDDIEGVRSKRLYRGEPKDIFKVDNIEGAYPHKVRRSPRSYAFDDYKDVTTATPYRRPMYSSRNFESQFLSPKREVNRTLPQGNYKVSEDLYNNMSYDNLPTIPKDNVHYSNNEGFTTDWITAQNPTNHLSRNNRQQLRYGPAQNQTYNPPSSKSYCGPPIPEEIGDDLNVFYGIDSGDTLDKEIMKKSMPKGHVQFDLGATDDSLNERA
ncbi:unnamed protein product [Moneuplotes crassus]|uniref:Uncharacterized protein n=1 Tax=Euplotes crassus TaxID=5936 RepID=A0AAD2D328_EUPCR|nr:unnamed protein product [Moneuplotes crassus]